MLTTTPCHQGLNILKKKNTVYNELSFLCDFFSHPRYVIQRIHVEQPSLHVSSEDLGGRPEEQRDPQTKEVVEQLIKIAEELNRNAEFQRYVIGYQQNQRAYISSPA